jgi:hypothetical protein
VLRNGVTGIWQGNRSFISFSQHYANLVFGHQIASAPPPWTDYAKYVQATFGDVKSVKQIILRAPSQYMDFVFLSMSKSLQNMFATGFLITLSFSIFGFWKTRERFQGLILLVFGVSMVPTILLSYMHIRYQARFYPIMLALAMTATLLTNKWQKIILLVGILAAVVYLLFSLNAMNAIYPPGYWGID